MTAPETAAATGAPPVDIAALRADVAEVLPPEVTPTDGAVLETLTRALRHGIELLIPEVERAAAQQPADDIPRYVALACIREARGKLEADPGPGPSDARAHVRRLGRSLMALCDHYVTLTGFRACSACDQLIKPGDATRPYDQDHPPGASAISHRIHAHCISTTRTP